MDNRRNSERDKILEEILDEVSKERKKSSEAPKSSAALGKAAAKNGSKPTVGVSKNAAARKYSAVVSAAAPADSSSKKSGTVSKKNVGAPVSDAPKHKTHSTAKAVKTSSETSGLKKQPASKASAVKGSSVSASGKLGTDKTGKQKPASDKPEKRASREELTAREIIARTDKAAKKPIDTVSEKINDTSAYSSMAPRSSKSTQKRKKRRKKRSARLPVALMVTTLIVTVSVVLSVVIIAVGRDMLAIGKDESLKMVTIPKGADTKQVAEILKNEGIIDIPKAFEFIVDMGDSGGSFRSGQFELSPSDAYETIINKLTTDPDKDKQTVEVTFVEGISVYDAAQQLEKKKVCDAERFLYYFNAGGYGFDFEEKLPTSTADKFYRMEGYLFPDTYKFYVGSDPESVCMKIYQNFENKMTDKYYDQMKKKGMTLDEVITLASIVQKEAPDAASMKKVASVFENRLSKPDEFSMLQSDPTTYYVEEIIKPNIQVPSTTMFDAYDTYKAQGLPPGAIGNPGIDAIEAVLYPADTDYYYFAADIDTKEIFYAKTLEEHEENLAQINGESTDDDSDEYDDSDDEDYYE